MTIAAARDEHTLRNLLYTAQDGDRGPFAIRYPRGSGRRFDWRNEMHALPIGRGERLADGSDVALLSLGPVAYDVAEAIAQAAQKGVKTAHYDMLFLKPIDEQILEEVAAKNCPVITVEDGIIAGGLGGAVAEWFAEKGLHRKLLRLGVPDKFVPQGTPAELHHMCGFDKDAIFDAIMSVTSNNSQA